MLKFIISFTVTVFLADGSHQVFDDINSRPVEFQSEEECMVDTARKLYDQIEEYSKTVEVKDADVIIVCRPL